METTTQHHSEAAWKPIIALDDSTAAMDHISFNPQEHLTYSPPQKIYKMSDIGYDENTGVSPIAASEPFQLFSPQAIEKFRAEIFKPEVMENCNYTGDLGAFMLRGYAPKYAPFVYDAWNDPATLKIVSDIAGIELVPNMNFEIGHINISVKTEEQAVAERNAVAKKEDSAPVVGWHRDSYPFVCVTMLSDCTNMIGGETAIRTANGEVMRIRGPAKGCAVVLQGRHITHQALKALGARERITMVTSFRPKSAQVGDDSVLDTVRGVSNLSELYYGYGEYRLSMLEERIRTQLDSLRRSNAAGKRTNTKALKQFLAESIQLLDHTNSELVPDEDVVPGRQPVLDIPDVMVDAGSIQQKSVKAKL